LLALGALWSPALASADQVVRFSTTLGNIDVRLLSADAPNTVLNFLTYVSSGEYNGTVIQRSVPGFVIQGGGYTFSSGGFIPIAAGQAIAGEFKDSNVRGTLAMALTSTSGGTADPNSATDQWFFNLANNATSLDVQKFTVFGQVVNQASLAVMDAIAAEPVDTTHASPNSAVPELTLSAGLTASNLIYVNSITLLSYPPPTITLSKPVDNSQFRIGQVVQPVYSCADPGGPGLASCTGPKTVDTSLYGTFKYTVTATDDAGTAATRSVTYEVIPYSIPHGPKLKIRPPALSPPFTVTRAGTVSLGLLCTANVRCVGRLTLLAGKHHTLIGSHHYSVGSQHTVRLSFSLNRKGRGIAKHAHGSLRASLALKPAGKHTHAKTHRLNLRVIRAT
jgi:cyclophilin family peptidyl-prolyl cis-trans isomerase